MFFQVFAVGDDTIVPPPGGVSLLGGDFESSLQLSNSPALGGRQIVTTGGVPFFEAVELHTLKKPDNIWDFQLVAPVSATIHKGDVLWCTMWMRALETSSETQEGFTQISLEQATPPYGKVMMFDLSAGKSWQQFAWVCTAGADFGANELHVCLRGGYKPQVIQMGGLQILDYGTSVQASDLPRSHIRYPGMEADAPWRKEANERIERYRKADVKIEVKDASGQPVVGATVRIQQLRHAFGFGSCVVAGLIEGQGPDNDRYREIIKNNFSKVVMENDLKWGNWEAGQTEGHKTTLDALQWLHDQGIQIRGHNLVWPSWKFSPKDLSSLKDNKVALEQRIEDHITDEVSATKGQLTEWDVVNEPYANHDILDVLGPDAMVTWFKRVHEIDPKPELFLNDYAGLVNHGEDSPHKDGFEKTLRMLKDQGAPIGGLGIQAHFGNEVTDPELIVKELDRWAALGLDIQITEFDINMDDEETQGQYTRDFMTAVFSHPAVSALLTWGFWEGADWIPQAALYRKDWSIKPNGQAWNDLVLKQWHTDVTGATDASGAISTRGFIGDYQITVTFRGVTKTVPLVLTKKGIDFSVTIPSG